jgi:hypothetical protein
MEALAPSTWAASGMSYEGVVPCGWCREREKRVTLKLVIDKVTGWVSATPVVWLKCVGLGTQLLEGTQWVTFV